MRAHGVCCGLALATAAAAACDNTPAVTNDAGPDVTTPDVFVTDAADELTSDADAADVDAFDGGVCGIDQLWTDLPQHLDCTGLYSDFANKVVSTAAHAYAPGLVFWSDAAAKQRWLYLPPNSKIDTSNMDEWTFPVGTKVWKEFQIAGHRVETRLYAKRPTGKWLRTTYLWTTDESDAVRLDVGMTNVVGTYEIPDVGTCDTCHYGRTDQLLGVEAIALALSTAQGTTLDWLAKNSYLTQPPSNTTATLPEDATNKAAGGLGFLHINCGVACHNQNPSSSANSSGFFARLPASAVLAGTEPVTSTDTWTTAANMAPTSATYSSYAQQGYKRLLPGNSAMSVIYVAANTRGPGQMPPIVSHVVDTTGVALLQTWIDALP